MSKASGSIDLKSLKVAGEPNKYITMVTGSGIRVHEANAVNTNYAQINSDGLTVRKDGIVRAIFGANSYIGYYSDLPISDDPGSNLTGRYAVTITSNTTNNGGLGLYNVNNNGYLFWAGADSDSNGLPYYTFGIRRKTYNNTIAIGANSFSAGYDNVASGTHSMALGRGLIAVADYQAVFGKYNQTDLDAMFIIGNGTSNTRSNLMVIGDDDIRIGNTDSSHIQMDYRSLRLIDKDDNEFLYVSDLRDEEDNYQAIITETFQGDGTKSEFLVQLPVSAEISATDSSNASNTATRNNSRYTFTSAPANNATITIVYKTNSTGAKAYTLGLRKANTLTGTMSFAEGSNITASGFASHAEGTGTTASGFVSHAEGNYTTASGWASHAENHHARASGSYSHAEGYYTIASSSTSHAEGWQTEATGQYSHAEGAESRAEGLTTHAEGASTIASGNYAHAEGHRTHATGAASHTEGVAISTGIAQYTFVEATGTGSHAEGGGTKAIGDYAHSEGFLVTASGHSSHAQNLNTIASMKAQTAIGTFNIADSAPTNAIHVSGTEYGNYAFLIGNGSSSSGRSNALTVDWNGGVELYLDVDSSASSSTDATSGTDAGLFNNIRAMGWYSDVIS